jgi:copper chaperone CopZ
MTKTYFILSILAFAFTFNSCSNESQPLEPKNMFASFQIEGMVCEHGCKGVIEKEMKGVSGITSFDIDFEAATAEVFFDQNTITSKAIVSEVESINDGIYKMKLIEEHEQMNAKEKLPASSNSPVSVYAFNFQLPNIPQIALEWIKL